jgi:hypothetical protein
MKRLFALLTLASSLFAQGALQADHYQATAATTAMTVQAVSTTVGNARQIVFSYAVVYCATASTAIVQWNGAAATSTAGTELKLPGTFQPSTATVWTSSNVGTSTIGNTYGVPAGYSTVIDLSAFSMGSQGSAANLTIKTSNSCTITFNYAAI